MKSYGDIYVAKKEGNNSDFLYYGDRFSFDIGMEAKYHFGPDEPSEHKVAGGNGSRWKQYPCISAEKRVGYKRNLGIKGYPGIILSGRKSGGAGLSGR